MSSSPRPSSIEVARPWLDLVPAFGTAVRLAIESGERAVLRAGDASMKAQPLLHMYSSRLMQTWRSAGVWAGRPASRRLTRQRPEGRTPENE